MAETVTLYAKKDGKPVTVSTPSRVADLLASGDYSAAPTVEELTETEGAAVMDEPAAEVVVPDETTDAVQEKLIQSQAKTTKPKAKTPTRKPRQ